MSKVKASLSDGLEARRKYDAEQAELARLRREEEERKAEAERQRIAAEAAAKARQEPRQRRHLKPKPRRRKQIVRRQSRAKGARGKGPCSPRRGRS